MRQRKQAFSFSGLGCSSSLPQLSQGQKLPTTEVQRHHTLQQQQHGMQSQPLQHAAAPTGSPPLEPPSRHSSRLSPDPLPLGWKAAVTAEGVTYYYNKGLKVSQFERPRMPATIESTVPSPPLAPPPRDASPHVGSAPFAFATPTAQMPQSMPATKPMQQSASSSNTVSTWGW